MEKVKVEDTQECLKSRHVLGILGFLGVAILYATRFSLSVAIVAMVNNTALQDGTNNTFTFDACPLEGNSSIIDTKPEGPFDWDKKTQGVVLGSFFYGYFVTQVPGGRLAELFGGKLVFGIGVLATGLLTMLGPIAAHSSFTLFIVLRVLLGVSQGVTLPAMQVMLAKWSPPLERNKFSSYVYSGADFGIVISTALSGWLCTLDLWGGWPLCFYIFGGLGVIWYAFWLFLIYDTPSTHPRIDPQEKKYILECIGHQDEDERPPIPWLKILTCMPLWAILVTKCGLYWSLYTRLQEVPTFLNNILHFDIQKNAVLSALPALCSWCFSIVASAVADWLLAKGYLSLGASYKIFNSIATVLPSFGLMGVAWFGCDRTAAVLLLIIPSAFVGAQYAGNQMNPVALSPHFAGTMFGITNAAGSLSGFIAPYVVGLLTQGEESVEKWSIVFYLAAGITICTNMFYVIFGSAEEQPWSKPKQDSSSANMIT